MQAKTADYLATGDDNRDLANALIIAATPVARDWVAVIAFYAAVHYMNAYIYEKQQHIVTPDSGGHKDRSKRVKDASDLQGVASAYIRLSNLAYNVRYEPRYHLSDTVARTALRHMEAIEQVVKPLVSP